MSVYECQSDVSEFQSDSTITSFHCISAEANPKDDKSKSSKAKKPSKSNKVKKDKIKGRASFKRGHGNRRVAEESIVEAGPADPPAAPSRGHPDAPPLHRLPPMPMSDDSESEAGSEPAAVPEVGLPVQTFPSCKQE